MKNILLVFSFFFAVSSFGQDLSQYKYVVVPERFSFLKEKDQHQLNSLTKFLFEKYGFVAYIEGEEEYISLNPDRCEGLYADVLSDSNMFSTKLKVVLKDCRNLELFVSREGVSREKNFKIAYHEALRKAFESVEALNHSGNEVVVSGTPILNIKAEAGVENRKEQPSAIVQDEKRTVNSTVAEPRESLPVQGHSSSEKISNMNLVRDGKSYFLSQNDLGFNLYHKGTTEPFARLFRSSAGNSFIYNSMTSKGIACIDKEGNLIIEVLKDDGNSLETIVYRPQDQ